MTFKRIDAIWIILFLVIFLLTQDYWNWNKTQPLIYGLPYWIIYFLVITLILSLYYYWIAKHVWRD